VSANGVGMVEVHPMGESLILQCTRCPWALHLGVGEWGVMTINRYSESHVDKVHTGGPLPPGWASRQAAQPDPHVIRIRET
jgi:hypothetical protein